MSEQQFDWTPHPEAGALTGSILDRFLGACPRAADLRDRMASETATRFADWIWKASPCGRP